VSAGLAADACSAGTTPNTTPATIDTARPMATIPLSNRTSVSRGRSVGIMATIQSLDHANITSAVAPPATATTRLSMSNCRMS
jgi:hypothetical protein